MGYGRRFTPQASQTQAQPETPHVSAVAPVTSAPKLPGAFTSEDTAPPVSNYESTAHIRAGLNGAKVVVDLLQGVFKRNEDLTPELIQVLTEKHGMVVDLVRQSLSPEDTHPALRAQIARATAQIVADLYEKDGDFNPVNAADLFLTMFYSQPTAVEEKYQSIEDHIEVRLSEAKAVVPIMPGLEKIDNLMGGKLSPCMWGGHNYVQAILHIRDSLKRIAKHTLHSIGAEPHSKESQIAYRSILSSASQIMKNVLQQEGSACVSELQGKSKTEIMAYVAQCATREDGFRLVHVEEKTQDVLNLIYQEQKSVAPTETVKKEEDFGYVPEM